MGRGFTGQVKKETKYHRVGNEIRPCTATVRTCPYEHFDSLNEAKEKRQKIATGLNVPHDVVNFSVSIDDAEPTKETLRDASNEFVRRYVTTGARPKSPIGEISVALPRNQKIVLRRETFDVGTGNTKQLAVRYYGKFFDGQNIESFTATMNSPNDYNFLDNKINKYVMDSADDDTESPEERETNNAILIDKYDKLMRTVAEVEIMSRGVNEAYSRLGVDLFSRENPNELNLNFDYKTSLIQSQDVIEALKNHAHSDPVALDVKIQVTQKLSETAKWALTREDDGSWYFTENETTTHRVVSPEETAYLLQRYMVESHANEKDIKEQCGFVANFVSSVEPAIQSYTHAVNRNNASFSNIIDSREQKTIEAPKGKISQRLFDMFS